ncbi:MAG: CoB--CoM heterodisulfide reductase iron-sulfur subunit B family protein [Syntrophales bacterium]|nr:CoB--CoM heterodisulfide reductase iron-sulfur subunit B family protein [Syntrophales bacterium]
MKEVSYYPGCSLHGTAREYDESCRGVSDILGIKLSELEDWNCCGASSAHCTDERLSIALAGRNLDIANKSARELLVPCVACFSRLKAAEKEIGEGGVPIRYALEFFSDEPVLEEMKKRLVRPLSGLKVVCYYGCLAVRPPQLTGVKEHENPQHMDRVVEAIDAEPIPWSYKTDCCGSSLMLARTDIVKKLTGRLLSMAREAEADCIVVGCPICQANLDTRQEELEKEAGENFNLPILYFTELMGLALGHKDVKKWLGRHIVDPTKMLSKKGLI